VTPEATPPVPATLNPTSSIVRALRADVAERDGWQCWYCGRLVVPPPRGRGLTTAEAPTAATLDHWVPRGRGGSWDLANLVLACRPCNEDKHTLTGPEYLTVLAFRQRHQAETTGTAGTKVPRDRIRQRRAISTRTTRLPGRDQCGHRSRGQHEASALERRGLHRTRTPLLRREASR
jgi:5-methylcytosine-specific restriction endonuclease McrA